MDPVDLDRPQRTEYRSEIDYSHADRVPMTDVGLDDGAASPVVRTPSPGYPASTLITHVTLDRARYHQGVGDMWPLTWAEDDHQYAGAGDNRHSPMNVWRITGAPDPAAKNQAHAFGAWTLDVVSDRPIGPEVYGSNPRADSGMGIKPAGLIEAGGSLVMAVQEHNYGENPAFNRQLNINGWLITSQDHGASWDVDATPHSFFTGRLASCHFVQYGRGRLNAPKGYIYAIFPGASNDGNSYWENGDYVLLGRVPDAHVLDRNAWTFYAGQESGMPVWSPNDLEARPVFEYPGMTGENHVSHNPELGVYLMGNYSFLDPEGRPRPYHQLTWPDSVDRSQLTLFEAPNLWGPWSLFHRDDSWGTYGDYQPVFPVKWMSNRGTTLFMVSSGSYDDYNFVVQRVDLQVSSTSP